jgi:putative transposase
MDERLRFIARLLEGEKMAPVCREFGISRVTGYKIFDRYKACGLDGLYDRSKAPYRQANKLPFQVERAILGIKKEFPSWGAPKIRDKLIREYPMIPPPAVSTIHAALDRNGLVKRRKRRRYKACGTPLSAAHTPNGLWCADYKGEFLLGNRQYCYPLTITDYRSRYLLACEGLESTKSASPSPSSSAPSGLRPAGRDPHRQRHALRRALGVVRAVSPGRLVAALRHPTAAHQARPTAAERTPRAHAPHAQERNDQARRVQLPAAAGALRGLHPGLQPGAAAPGARRRLSGEIYTPSARPTSRPQDPDYPFHDRTVRVTRCGRICLGSRKINLSVALAEQLVGIREVDDQVWQVSFLEYDLGYFDRDQDRVEPGPNPFAPDTVLTMCRNEM